MKKAPKGWPRISSALYYQDPRAAIDWLCKAFGFEVRILVEGEGGRIEHSELTYGEGVVMVSGEELRRPGSTHPKSPRSIGGANTQNMFLYVDDIEAHLARAEAAGATITQPLETSDYGPEYWSDRGYECADPEGHRWWFAQRLRDPVE